MTTRLAAVVFAALLLGTASTAAEPVRAQPSAVRTEKYPDWGFQVKVPRASAKHTLPAAGDTLLSELHTFGDLVYVVRVSRPPANTLASTAVEQEIQTLAKASGGRWEMSSRQGDLFKGLNRAVSHEELKGDEAAQLRKSLWGRDAVESISMAPLAEDAGPILTIGVIGPKSRAEEIENSAKFLAYGVERIDKAPGGETSVVGPAEPSPTEPSEPGAVTAKPPRPQVRNGAKRPRDLNAGKRPAPPAPARRALKKGEIELAGAVESIDGVARSMVMMVDRVVMPGLDPIPLDPVRRKTVHFRALPSGVRVGSRVAIAGRNTGVGKPMTADTIVIR